MKAKQSGEPHRSNTREGKLPTTATEVFGDHHRRPGASKAKRAKNNRHARRLWAGSVRRMVEDWEPPRRKRRPKP